MPLAELAKMAPNGYPAHSCLKSVLHVLQEEKDIFKLKDGNGETVPGLVLVKCTQAADVWRIMLKHAAVVKRSVRGSAHPGMRAVFEALTDVPYGAFKAVLKATATAAPPSSDVQPATSSLPRDVDGDIDFEALLRDGDDDGAGCTASEASGWDDDEYWFEDDHLDGVEEESDVEILSMRCRCRWCEPEIHVEDDHRHDDADAAAGAYRMQVVCPAPAAKPSTGTPTPSRPHPKPSTRLTRPSALKPKPDTAPTAPPTPLPSPSTVLQVTPPATPTATAPGVGDNEVEKPEELKPTSSNSIAADVVTKALAVGPVVEPASVESISSVPVPNPDKGGQRKEIIHRRLMTKQMEKQKRPNDSDSGAIDGANGRAGCADGVKKMTTGRKASHPAAKKTARTNKPKKTDEAGPVPEDPDHAHTSGCEFDDKILAPCKMRRRRNGPQQQETYLVHGPTFKYVLTVTGNMTEYHEEVVLAALEEVKDGRIETITALRSFVTEEIARRNDAGDIDMD